MISVCRLQVDKQKLRVHLEIVISIADSVSAALYEVHIELAFFGISHSTLYLCRAQCEHFGSLRIMSVSRGVQAFGCPNEKLQATGHNVRKINISKKKYTCVGMYVCTCKWHTKRKKETN